MLLRRHKSSQLGTPFNGERVIPAFKTRPLYPVLKSQYRPPRVYSTRTIHQPVDKYPRRSPTLDKHCPAFERTPMSHLFLESGNYRTARIYAQHVKHTTSRVRSYEDIDRAGDFLGGKKCSPRIRATETVSPLFTFARHDRSVETRA